MRCSSDDDADAAAQPWGLLRCSSAEASLETRESRAAPAFSLAVRSLYHAWKAAAKLSSLSANAKGLTDQYYIRKRRPGVRYYHLTGTKQR